MFRTVQIVSLLALLIGLPGCATKALWSEADLDTWNEPAETPNLRLFHHEAKKDFLVVYDEYRERSDAVRTKAYLLKANESRIETLRRPHFISAKIQRGLPTVSVFPLSLPHETNSPSLYAIVGANGHSFKIFSDDAEIIAHNLPVYNDGLGRTKRVALTPFAVAGDVTIIGGWIFLWVWAGGGLASVH